MLTVGRGSRARRNPKDIVTYTFVPTPTDEMQTVNLTYTVTPIQQSGDGFPDERSLAPFGNSPADKIGYARSSSDAGDGAVDTGAVNGAFVTTGYLMFSTPLGIVNVEPGLAQGYCTSVFMSAL